MRIVGWIQTDEQADRLLGRVEVCDRTIRAKTTKRRIVGSLAILEVRKVFLQPPEPFARLGAGLNQAIPWRTLTSQSPKSYDGVHPRLVTIALISLVFSGAPLP